MQRFLTHTVRVCCATLAFASGAQAVLLESEPFAYSSNLGGSVNTLNGGTGWGANAWADTDEDTDLAFTDASLSYPPGTFLSSSGSRLAITDADPAVAATRTLGTTMNLGAAGQTWYSSALFTRSAVTGELATVSFFSGVNLRWFYGIDANGKFTIAVDPAQATQRATSLASAEADITYFVVARIRTNTGPAGNDEVFLKFFSPTDTIAEPLNDAGWDLAANGNSGVTLSSIRLDFTNAAGQTNQFDEFRVGTTFADVAAPIPEPGTGAVLAMSTLVPLLARRRRR